MRDIMGVGRCSLTLVTFWAVGSTVSAAQIHVAWEEEGAAVAHGRGSRSTTWLQTLCAEGAAAPPPVVTAGSSCLGGSKRGLLS